MSIKRHEQRVFYQISMDIFTVMKGIHSIDSQYFYVFDKNECLPYQLFIKYSMSLFWTCFHIFILALFIISKRGMKYTVFFNLEKKQMLFYIDIIFILFCLSNIETDVT